MQFLESQGFCPFNFGNSGNSGNRRRGGLVAAGGFGGSLPAGAGSDFSAGGAAAGGGGGGMLKFSSSIGKFNLIFVIGIFAGGIFPFEKTLGIGKGGLIPSTSFLSPARLS